MSRRTRFTHTSSNYKHTGQDIHSQSIGVLSRPACIETKRDIFKLQPDQPLAFVTKYRGLPRPACIEHDTGLPRQALEPRATGDNNQFSAEDHCRQTTYQGPRNP
eukprot:2739153-Amphidinium_carterae.1